MCQYWSSVGETATSVEIVFHGIKLKSSSVATGGFGNFSGGDLIYLDSGNTGVARCDISAPLRKENIVVSVSLDTLRKSIRPSNAQLSPLKSRDILPDSRRLHQLILTYPIKVTEDVTSIKPIFARANGVLYDSYFENYSIQSMLVSSL